MRHAVILGCLVITTRFAHADWVFDWHCQSNSSGDCGQTGLSGTEGPFASEGDCESAQNRVRERINSPGNAGTASSCREVGAGSSGGGGYNPSSDPNSGRPARFDRVYLGAVGASGYSAAYANGRNASSSMQEGAQLEVVLGLPKIGLSLFLGVDHDDGTAPDAATAVTPLWLIDWGIGLAASPFSIVAKPSFEIRPELGAYLLGLDRYGCDHCSTDGPLGTQMPAEPGGGFGGRVRVGLDFYFASNRTTGVALDALIQLVKLGDSADPLSTVQLTPPRVMIRLSLVHRASP